MMANKTPGFEYDKRDGLIFGIGAAIILVLAILRAMSVISGNTAQTLVGVVTAAIFCLMAYRAAKAKRPALAALCLALAVFYLAW